MTDETGAGWQDRVVRPDNLPVNAEVQQKVMRAGRLILQPEMQALMDHFSKDHERVFVETNRDLIERTLAAPLEAAVYGITSVEIAKGGKSLYKDGEPAPSFGELKLRFKEMNQDLAKTVAEYAQMGPEERQILQDIYIHLSARLTAYVDRNLERRTGIPVGSTPG